MQILVQSLEVFEDVIGGGSKEFPKKIEQSGHSKQL